MSKSSKPGFLRSRTPLRLLILGTAAILTLGIISRPADAPPDAPETVLTKYFEAWGRMDYPTLLDLSRTRDNGNLLDEVSNLYVINRMRQSRDLAPLVKPPGEPGSARPYGPSDLRLTEIRGSETQRVFNVEYTRHSWDEKSAPELRRERYSLTKKRKGWVITGIEKRD